MNEERYTCSNCYHEHGDWFLLEDECDNCGRADVEVEFKCIVCGEWQDEHSFDWLEDHGACRECSKAMQRIKQWYDITLDEVLEQLGGQRVRTAAWRLHDDATVNEVQMVDGRIAGTFNDDGWITPVVATQTPNEWQAV